MLSIIAGAEEGEWFDMPEGTRITGGDIGEMEVARIRRVNGDLDVEDGTGRVWRFTEVSFTEMFNTIENENIKVERPKVTWAKVQL